MITLSPVFYATSDGEVISRYLFSITEPSVFSVFHAVQSLPEHWDRPQEDVAKREYVESWPCCIPCLASRQVQLSYRRWSSIAGTVLGSIRYEASLLSSGVRGILTLSKSSPRLISLKALSSPCSPQQGSGEGLRRGESPLVSVL